MTPRLRSWGGALALGVGLSVAAIWPVDLVPVGRDQVLWQPWFLTGLLGLTFVRARRVGWAAAASQALVLYALFTLASWLPWLRTIPSTPEFRYPAVYHSYLALYEASLAALIGAHACYAVAPTRAPAWWPAGRWSRPLVVTPLLLLGRALGFGHWLAPFVGLAAGAALAVTRPLTRAEPVVPRACRRLSWTLLLVSACLVAASGLWFYRQLGSAFPSNSDDGPAFYASAMEIARHPSRIWTAPPIEANMFTSYIVLMGLWFKAAGPSIPLWLIWQGAAAGVLAVVVYQFGRWCGSRLVGLAAAGFVMADHVMLHLMSTLNMEVGFIPALYGGLWMWATAGAHPSGARPARCFWAGALLGVSMTFRPTSALLPCALLVLLFVERPRLSWRELREQAGWMLAGFALPLTLVLVRHRLAWGEWTIGGAKATPASWGANYAWTIHGQHPAQIGLGAWMKVLASDPSAIWREMIPHWWEQMLHLWTHPGFGQMDLIQGLNFPGVYQAGLTGCFVLFVVVGAGAALRERRRAGLVLLALPAYFTSLTLVFWVINTRYRAPFIPALYLLACLGCLAIVSAIRGGMRERSSRAAVATPEPGRLAYAGR